MHFLYVNSISQLLDLSNKSENIQVQATKQMEQESRYLEMESPSKCPNNFSLPSIWMSHKISRFTKFFEQSVFPFDFDFASFRAVGIVKAWDTRILVSFGIARFFWNYETWTRLKRKDNSSLLIK